MVKELRVSNVQKIVSDDQKLLLAFLPKNKFERPKTKNATHKKKKSELS